MCTNSIHPQTHARTHAIALPQAHMHKKRTADAPELHANAHTVTQLTLGQNNTHIEQHAYAGALWPLCSDNWVLQRKKYYRGLQRRWSCSRGQFYWGGSVRNYTDKSDWDSCVTEGNTGPLKMRIKCRILGDHEFVCKARRWVIQIFAYETSAPSKFIAAANWVKQKHRRQHEHLTNFGNVKGGKNKCNLPTSSFQMILCTLLSVLIAPHHHGVSESVLASEYSRDVFFSPSKWKNK